MNETGSRRSILKVAGTTAAAAGFAGCIASLADEPEFTDERDPPAILLTWQDDPTATMTIDWHTHEDDDESAALDYRPLEGDDEWRRATGQTHPFEDDDPNTTYERDVQRVELTNLRPATTYEFRVGVEPIWRFRTMPRELEERFTYASGGDTGHRRPFDAMLEVVAERDPEFLSICGDFPIADGGRQSGAGRMWKRWFESVKEGLITDEGRVIPIVAGIGNHECRTGYVRDASSPFEYENTAAWREWQAPYFYSFFAFPGHPGYGVLDFGDYLSIPMLDTGHTAPIGGAQTDWLETVLSAREDVSHVFPNYHVPIYPGVDERSNANPPNQTHWPPLFERYDVDFAFEHHIHHFKRTVPIEEGEPSEDGVVYMGNGNLGQMAPSLTDPDRWWIDAAEQTYNVHLVTLTDDDVEIETVDEAGDVVDTVVRDADGGAVRTRRR